MQSEWSLPCPRMPARLAACARPREGAEHFSLAGGSKDHNLSSIHLEILKNIWAKKKKKNLMETRLLTRLESQTDFPKTFCMAPAEKHLG